MDDLGVEVPGLCRPGREDGDAPRQRGERPQPDRRWDRSLTLAADRDDQVRDQPPVGVEVRGEVVARTGDEDPPVGCDRRDRRTAAVEDDDLGTVLLGEAGPLEHVRDEGPAGEPAAGAAAADRRHARDGGDLEMVGGGVATRAREREQLVDPGGLATSSGVGGPPRPIVTTTTSCVRESRRARCAESAVFPTRLPVPITAIAGTSICS